jgi:DNA-binding transcriptional ArsR family regulator
MATAVSSVQTQSATEPFVGPRPFEPHEQNVYHGRKADAQILCDRILSARLTILYAQSGLGKSSLLRIRILPMIEDNGAHAIYFDNWSQPDPLLALKQALATLAGKLNIPDPAYGSPTLAEFVRLIHSATGLSVVLILDQFEDFLVRSADHLDPLRSELAALVRHANTDAAVVLTLREEYLAALEPFRQKIGNLFESAYRLEEMSKKDLQEAILEPPKLFGAECEPALAEKLIADLKRSTPDAASDPRTSFVGLPMLQLVCQELWKQAKGNKLTLDLYDKQLGGAQRIIDKYVSSLMPKTARGKTVTAELLKYLAPRSGLKTPYSVEDFVVNTRFTPSTIEAELKRLAKAGILRTRNYNKGVTYELQHDAFIKVLRDWRDEVLEHNRRRKTVWRVLGIACALALLCTVLLRVRAMEAQQALQQAQQERQEARLKAEQALKDLQAQRSLERMQTERQVAQLKELKAQQALKDLKAREKIRELQAAAENERRAQEARTYQELLEGGLLKELEEEKDEKKRNELAPGNFDVFGAYELWRKTDDPHSLDKLKNVLQAHQNLLPPSYGLRPAEEYKWPEDAPLTIEYPPSRKNFTSAQFMIVWRDYATELGRRYGYPVPLNVGFREASDLKVGELGVCMAPPAADACPKDATRIRVTSPTYDDQLVVRFKHTALKDARAKEFLGHYVDTQPFPADGRWFLIPRWSLPVWKLAKETEEIPLPEVAIDANGLAAYHILSSLVHARGNNADDRAALLTEPGIETLLESARKTHPAAVDEARAVRGDSLPGDVSEAVVNDPYALLDLPLLLDQLADRRCDQPNGTEATAPGRSPSTQTSCAEQADASAVPLVEPSRSPAKAAQRPRSDSDLRFAAVETTLPSEDERLWISGARLPPAAFEKVREQIYCSYGVTLPTPKYSEDVAPARVLRVHLTAGTDGAAAVLSGAAKQRRLWLTPDETRTLLDHLPVRTRAWIEGEYSLTSVKRLLRTVVDNSDGQEGGMRYATWLLPSLCFWAAADGQNMRDAGIMADHLLQVQRARIHPPAAKASQVRAQVEAGIETLLADNVYGAYFLFAAALGPNRQNRQDAEQAFLELWPQHLPQVWLGSFGGHFQNLDNLDLDALERLDLQDLPSRGMPDNDVRRQLSIYRLAAGVVDPAERSVTLQNVLNHSGAAPWSAAQARWVAVEFLKQYDPVQPQTGSESQVADATRLLNYAVLKSDQETALNTFHDVVSLSVSVPGKPDASRDIPNWSWRILNDLAASRPNGAPLNLPFELAWVLADEEIPDRLKRSLQLSENYRKLLATSNLKQEQRSQQNELVDYARAKALLHLGLSGDSSRLPESEALFNKLRSSEWISSDRQDLLQSIYANLIELLGESGRPAEAHAVWQDARTTQWPDDYGDGMIEVDTEEMFRELAAGNASEAARLANLAAQHGKDSPASLFEAAIGSIITNQNDWRSLAKRFLSKEVEHPYKDYVLMIYYAMDGGPRSPAAASLFRERWNEIQAGKANWSARLRVGDTSAWHEMLIGRFFGAPETVSLLDVVNDEALWKKSDFAYLPLTERGLRCEAWFYEAMRAMAQGNTKYMRECLQRCRDLDLKVYEEDGMARFLLAKIQP